MRTQTIHSTPQQEATAQVAPVDANLAIFTEREQIANQIKGLEARKKLLDEDIKALMQDGERFGNGVTELYLCPVERATFDWKSAITAGLFTHEQAQPFIERTLSSQLRTRKLEKSTETVDPATKEGQAMRDRLEKASKGLVS